MGGDLFELELYHKIIKKCPVLRDLWKTTFEYTLQKFYWLHVIPNSKSVLENHKKFTDVVRFFQFILSCIIMNVPFNFHLFKYIFLQVGLAPPFFKQKSVFFYIFLSKIAKNLKKMRELSKLSHQKKIPNFHKSGNALEFWIFGCMCILESSGCQNSRCT